jgi:hypothetical protein
MKWVLPLLAMLLAVAPATARQTRPTAVDPSAACEAAIDTAQDLAQLPPGLLSAISLVESGRPDPQTGAVRPWPWTIDVGGLGFFFPTKAAAVAAVRSLQELGIQSIDVGCLQVNLMYHPNAFASLEQAFDPYANARYASRFLDALYERSGSWVQAAGDYHSQTPSLGAAYRTQVLARWHAPAVAEWRGAYAAFAPAEAVYAAFRQNLAYGAFVSPPLQGPGNTASRRGTAHAHEALDPRLRQWLDSSASKGGTALAYGDFLPAQPQRTRGVVSSKASTLAYDDFAEPPQRPSRR